MIENVPGAPLRTDVMLCGSMFDLAIRRHRWFESNMPLPPWTPPCNHSRPITGVYGHPHGEGGAWKGMLPGTLAIWSREMGIDWMTAVELADAIPPAYTEWIGVRLLAAIKPAGSGFSDFEATDAALSMPGPPIHHRPTLWAPVALDESSSQSRRLNG